LALRGSLALRVPGMVCATGFTHRVRSRFTASASRTNVVSTASGWLQMAAGVPFDAGTPRQQ
jgi:hypothetical protein